MKLQTAKVKLWKDSKGSDIRNGFLHLKKFYEPYSKKV